MLTHLVQDAYGLEYKSIETDCQNDAGLLGSEQDIARQAAVDEGRVIMATWKL